MKPSGECLEALENKGDSTLPAERCTTGCTEKPERLDELARIIALVARLPPKDVTRAIENGHAAAHPLVKQAAEVFGGTVTNVEHAKPEGGKP